ncbi:hypothetical protein O181_018889 [Austropuccinia psidii MF-1]|uniref:UPF3 domain-containing protein n=1 Tax=Austropuccinia psidii MF-1 TaxID=1389203 RepID=A0A9Q3C619_9BASI|nr:hypothetical protein [Austropuccinia psidii MF-1]
MSERTKLVIRHLPPTLPEEIFWKTLSPWLEPIPRADEPAAPPKCVAIYKCYVAGKVRQNKSKVDIPSRAYIQFATSDQVVEFNQGYSNQAFRDSKGNITFPKVEFAPYQKVAAPPKKVDPRLGTIESDPEYQEFIKRLNDPTNAQSPDPVEPASDTLKPEEPKITPLIEHLRNVHKAAQEAASAPKQSSKPSPNPPNKINSERAFTGQPQIMKRIVPSDNAPPPSSSIQPPTVSANQHQHTPIVHSALSVLKPTKQNKTSPTKLSTSVRPTAPSSKPSTPNPQSPPVLSNQTSQPSPDKSSHSGPSAKPSRAAKRLARELESQSFSSSQSKDSPRKPTTQPVVLQSSKKQPSFTQETQTVTISKSGRNSSNSNPQSSSKGKPTFVRDRGTAKNYGNGDKNSHNTRAGGGDKPGRGGSNSDGPGKKSSAKAHLPMGEGKPLVSPTLIEHPKRSSHPAKLPASQGHNPRADEPPCAHSRGETAGARRQLGMALAGITGKSERRKKDKFDTQTKPPPAT